MICNPREKRHQKPGHENRIKKVLKTRQGMTLVELIVTFALLSMFAVSTCMMLSSAIKVYHQIRGLNNVRQVADTLLDKVSGMLEGASNSAVEGAGDTIINIHDEGTVIEFVDRTGSPVAISTTDMGDRIDGRAHKDYPINQLLIYYFEVTKPTKYEAVDWTFDKSVYMGYQIESLKFKYIGKGGGSYPQNVFEITLVLKSDSYGSFTSKRYVECYNFNNDSDFARISSDYD